MFSLQGHLLVASPHLEDPNFNQSVVLIIRHGPDGALGVVLNRPTQDTIGDIWTRVRNEVCTNAAPLYLGGPVAGPLLALHEQQELADLDVIEGLFCTMDPDKLKELVFQPEPAFRAFAGQAGWGEGQLEGEMETGSWLTKEAGIADVLERHPHSLWNQVMAEISGTAAPPGPGTSLPQDPSLN